MHPRKKAKYVSSLEYESLEDACRAAPPEQLVTIVRSLLKRGVNPNGTQSNHPLHLCSERLRPRTLAHKVMCILVHYGASIDITDDGPEGKLINMGIKEKDVEEVKFLISLGAKADVLPLERIMCRCKDSRVVDICELALDNGCRATQRVFDIAVYKGYDTIVERCLRQGTLDLKYNSITETSSLMCSLRPSRPNTTIAWLLVERLAHLDGIDELVAPGRFFSKRTKEFVAGAKEQRRRALWRTQKTGIVALSRTTVGKPHFIESIISFLV